eukprot:849897-Prorocentrum_minimum.AAC.1
MQFTRRSRRQGQCRSPARGVQQLLTHGHAGGHAFPRNQMFRNTNLPAVPGCANEGKGIMAHMQLCMRKLFLLGSRFRSRYFCVRSNRHYLVRICPGILVESVGFNGIFRDLTGFFGICGDSGPGDAHLAARAPHGHEVLIKPSYHRRIQFSHQLFADNIYVRVEP